MWGMYQGNTLALAQSRARPPQPQTADLEIPFGECSVYKSEAVEPAVLPFSGIGIVSLVVWYTMERACQL